MQRNCLKDNPRLFILRSENQNYFLLHCLTTFWMETLVLFTEKIIDLK